MRTRLAAAGVLLAILGAVAALLVTGGDGPPPPSPSPAGTIGPEGMELLALLERSRRETFHATYRAVGAETRGLTVEIWRKPPQEREDTISGPGRAAHSAAFLLADGVVACSREGLRPWSCRRIGSLPGGGAFALVESIRAEISGKKVAARDEAVGGRAARCFVLALRAGDAELCLTAEGIPVRLVAGDVGLLLVSLSDEVRDEVFRPPAPA